MKKLVVIALGVVMASSAFAQGYLQFQNGTAGSTHVYTNTVAGRGKVPLTAGLLNYGLFIGAGTVASNSLTLGKDNSTGAFLVAGNSTTVIGRFNTATADAIKQVQGIPGGTTVTIQIRAWSASYGNDWVTASTAVGAWWGASAINSTFVTGNASPGVAVMGTGATQVLGFDVFQNVPEPSTIALGALGLLGAFMIRRRK